MRNVTKVLFTIVAALLVASVTGCSAKSKLERRLKQADRSFDAGDYQTAEVHYKNALQLSHLNPHAISRLGTIYFEEGRIDRAYPYLTKASELLPDDLDLQFKVGSINLAVGRRKEAREKALLVLAANPKHMEAPLLLAEASGTPKEILDARLQLNKLAGQIGETAPIHLAIGVLSLRERNVKGAEESITAALKLDPKFAAAHQAMASIFAARNDLKRAQAAFKTASDLSPIRSPRHLAYAEFLIKTGQTDEGLKVLAETTKQAPDYLPAWNKHAEAALLKKDYETGLSSIKQVLSRDSANIEALLLRGRVFLAQRDGKKAVEDLERTSNQFNGKSPQAQYFLALAHLLNNDSVNAFKSVSQAVTLNTNYTEANLLLAKLNIARGESAAALPVLTQMVKQYPHIEQSHFLLADAYLNQGKPEEAASVLQHMMTLFPKNHEIPFAFGNTLIAQNKMAQARRAFEKSSELAPDFFPALERLVDLDINDKKYAAAIERVQRQIAKYPAAAESWMLMAKIHLAQKQMDQAESALLKAIQINPEMRNPYLLLSQVYLSQDRKQQALEKLNKLVLTSTNDFAAYMQIGMIQDSLTNYPAARDAYEKLLTINPKFSPALNNLAYLYSEHLNDLDQAYKMAERARQQAPLDPSSGDTLGWVLYKRGEYSRALGLLLESASKLPGEPEVQLHLGMTHYMMGNIEGARVALEAAARGGRDFPGKEQAGERLAILKTDLKTANETTLKTLEKALRSQPGDPVVLGLIAGIYERDGASDKAAKTYREALDQNPKNVEAMFRLGSLYADKLNEPKKALELAREARNLAPDDGRVAHLLGRLVYETGDYKWALSLIQDASRRLPSGPQLLYDLAWATYSVGDVAEAESKMQEAVKSAAELHSAVPRKTFSKLEEAKRFLAFVAATKNPAQANSMASQTAEALKANPDYVPALMLSAQIQEGGRNFAEAKRFYEKILSANGLFTPAMRNLAILYADDSEFDQKKYDLAMKARAAFPSDIAVARALGILTYRKGDYSRSAQLLKESAAKQPDPAILYYLGMAQYHLKDRVASKASLRRALDLKLTGNLATEANKILAELK